MRKKKPWEMSEEEIAEREELYLEKLNWFQQLMDNHLYYMFIMVFTSPMWFLIGLVIGMVIAK
jgi:hypothetical protein